MDEIEWWEFDSAKEMAEQVAGDIGFVIESALEAHKGARLAVPGGSTPDLIYAELLKRKDIDWTKVTLIPTDDRLVPLGDGLSNYRKLDSFFGAKKADIVSLIDEAALDNPQEAGRLADARLSLLQWPLDLACLGMGADGHTASIFPGPDFDAAVNGPRTRRAIGVRPDPLPEAAPVPRVTLTAPALASARTVMIVISGAEKRRVLEQALKEGPLSSHPIGRVVSAMDVPIDIYWSAE
ncbi:6-phosphogluconolactonase [Sphingosinicella sp. BN140058]|uniref:6-phosphogluconolactonase n=1 Tax=Sphingosinicella sp. BN140058 TaxID=1892855 RepID=UPI001013573B|nr:6-phosphogluconolactonase [Sphingosinicella sp. BN140058]QAY78587.1 6-phosphogluconolactonase [Sphingosinicella sp. BN140058]